MKFNKNLQRRFWIGTVWPGHCNLNKTEATEEEIMTAYRHWWILVSSSPMVQWVEAQIEIGDTGERHIQVALKTTISMRWGTLAERLKASWQPAENWNAVVNYCKKSDGRIEYLGAIGNKPASRVQTGTGTAKLRAIKYLKDGKSPEWIALNDSQAYFTHHRAILELHKMLIRCRMLDMSEEE